MLPAHILGDRDVSAPQDKVDQPHDSGHILGLGPGCVQGHEQRDATVGYAKRQAAKDRRIY
jgi:hypothetical protein